LGNPFKGGNAFFSTPHQKDFASGVYDESTGLVKFRNIVWFTNMDFNERFEDLILYKKFFGNESEYPTYDNYDAINIDKTKDIPNDYTGVMGVPITFLDKYNPHQFQLLGIMNTGEENIGIRFENTPHGRPLVNGVEKYLRILIKRIDEN
jgi:hypothetical protein